MISKGELILSLVCVALGLLLGMWGIFLTVHAPKKQVFGWLIVSAIILFGAIYAFDWNSKISPVNRTIAFYEANDFGRKMWIGGDHEPINLMNHPILEAETPPEGKHSYILSPAIRHQSSGVRARVNLFLRVPDACQLKPMDWVYSRKKWAPPNKAGADTEYHTIIDDVEDGVFAPSAEFGFEVSMPRECRMIFTLYGTDNLGRKINRREILVKLILK